MRTAGTWTASLALGLLAACTDGSEPAVDAGDIDAMHDDGGRADGGQTEHGFEIRLPETHMITCSEYPTGYPEGPQEFDDADWLCTFDDGAAQGHIYVQSSPIDCGQGLFMFYPIFETGVAAISIAGEVSALDDAEYDWGGNHHNDSLSFGFAGKQYVYDHSSFGPGYRACAPVDCMRVFVGSELIEDGCTQARTLPIVCEEIHPDGSHDPLEDTFEPCV